MSETKPSPLAKLLAWVVLLLSGAGLEIQAELFLRDLGPSGLWMQAGYFTTWSNLLAFLLAALTLLAPGEAGPKLRLTATTALLAVWAGYGESLHGHGPWSHERLTLALLHDATPLATLMLWLARPHGGLDRRALLLTLAFPAIFLLVALIRRFTTGWVPYGFLGQEGAALSINLAAVLAVVAGLALLLMLADRLLAQRAMAVART